MNDAGQRHELAGAAANIEGIEIAQGFAAIPVGLQDDVVFLAVLDVGGHLLGAEHDAQRMADRGGRDAQRGGLVAVDVHRQTRRGRLVVQTRPDQAGVALGRVQDRLDPAGQGLILVALCDEIHVGARSAALGPAALEGTADRADDAGRGDRSQLMVQLGGHLVGGHLAMPPVRQHDAAKPGVELRAAEPRNAQDIAVGDAILDQLVERRLGLHGGGQGVVVASALRRQDVEVDAAPVFRRDKLLGQDDEQARGDQRQGHDPAPRHENPGARPQEILERLGVGIAQPVHEGVDVARQPALPARRAQQLGRQHRRQAERQQGREEHGRCNGHGQFHEQAPDVARQHHQRREHGDQDHGRGDHGEEHLPRAALGGHQRGFALVDASLDVLDHDDGVVDHQANG